MRIVIAAVGRLKAEERGLYDRYAERLDQTGRGVALGPLTLVEIPESRAASAAQRMAEEAQRLLQAAESAELRVVLDERGKALSSVGLANLLRAKRDDGVKTMAYLLGGADGHGESLRKSGGTMLSLSPLTLPHGLARIVLAEQLYRAATILAGHPYHRA
jgi:23S rRNA (pseudouridine1915-N3)-methyltransferase